MEITDIRWHRQANCLEIIFKDGQSAQLDGRFLRTNSPSAETQGHGKALKIQPTQPSVKACMVALEPIGNYALKITFSDGHCSGLYQFDYLYQLAQFATQNRQE